MNEGIIIANKLGQNEIKVRLTTDAALFSFLPEVQLVVVGADTISSEGLVNKIGTFSLSLSAREYKIDFYALCGTEKFLPKGRSVDLKDPKEPKEVLKESLANVRFIVAFSLSFE